MTKQKHKRVYLDNAATTKPFDEVVLRVAEVMKQHFGNPSSLHQLGLEAEDVLQHSREMVAASLQVQPAEITFTSGGTEANNLVLKGAARAHHRKGKHFIASSIEHKSVLNTLQSMEEEGYEVTYLPVKPDGIIDVDMLERALRDDTILVSVMHVNNETGAIQPVDQVGDIIRSHPGKPLFHVDAVQSYGKIPLHPKQSGIDLLTISSHKIHGPKGMGALYKNHDVRISPLIEGGEQERGLRSGTENLPGIAGFAKAVEVNFTDAFDKQNYMRKIRNNLNDKLLSEFKDIRINTPEDDHAAPHILNVSFPGMKGEVLLRNLEASGIYVSTGSACTSGRNTPSHVLNAMGLREEEVQGALRFSFSSLNNQDEVAYVMEHIVPAVQRLNKMIS